MKIICIIKTLLISLLLPYCLYAQKYSFTCDTYNNEGICTYRGIEGRISLTTDADDLPVLLVAVSNPEGKRIMPFGYWTDPETSYSIKHMNSHLYDESLRDVYYITDNEDEFMLAIKHENSIAQYIIMSYRYKTKPPTYIHIPYSETTYDRIWNIIKAAKRNIGFKEI